MTEPDWTRYPNFTRDELRCKCGCDRAEMSPQFMDRLQRFRTFIGDPFIVTSGFRCPAHNAAVSTTGEAGPHTTGRAVDFACFGKLFCDMRDDAADFGFTGLGAKQHGPHEGRFIHLDDLPNKNGQPRPWGWTYP